MGNDRFNSLLNHKKYKPNVFSYLPLTALSGRRVAIDANNWMYSRMSVVSKQLIKSVHPTKPINRNEIRIRWVEMLLDFILKWLAYEITPIFIFDGVHPQSKQGTQQERRQKKIQAEQRLQELNDQLAQLDPLGNHTDLYQEILKERINAFRMDTSDFELMMEILQKTEVPVFRARAEGERLCSLMCLHGVVSAVFTSDSDVLAMGCPLQIKNFEKTKIQSEGYLVDQIKVIRTPNLMSIFNLNINQLQDLYIMTGCDYNQKIAGLGGITALRLIHQYGSLNSIPDEQLRFQRQDLNIEECRRNFSVADWKSEIDELDELIRLDLPTQVSWDLMELLRSLGLERYYNLLNNHYSNLPPMIEGRLDAPRISFVETNSTPPAQIKIIPISIGHRFKNLTT